MSRENGETMSSRRASIAMLAFAVVVLLLASAAADRLLRPDAFPIQTIHLLGEFKHVNSELLRDVIVPAANGNFFAVDLDHVEAAAESVAWVGKATVRRRWPRALEINVREHQLQARWGETAWVNLDGDVVELPVVEETRHLPRLNGPFGSHQQVLTRYQRWGALLAGAGLRIDELTLTARGTWQIVVTPFAKTANASNLALDVEGSRPLHRPPSFSLVLGKDDLEVRIARFARTFNVALAPRSVDIEQVDLRYPNGFAIKWKVTRPTRGNAAA